MDARHSAGSDSLDRVPLDLSWLDGEGDGADLDDLEALDMDETRIQTGVDQRDKIRDLGDTSGKPSHRRLRVEEPTQEADTSFVSPTVLHSDATSPDSVTTESILAHKLAGLSMADREKVTYDIHGVADVVQEDSETVDGLLADLHRNLKTAEARHELYRTAVQQNPNYVASRSFRLAFLRRENYDIDLATRRILEYFEMKQKLFGAELLGKQLQISDLDEDSQRCLHSGIGQILPLADRAGRPVFFWSPPRRIGHNLQSRVSLHLYLCRAQTETWSMESQQNDD